jgi:hypothetical protein
VGPGGGYQIRLQPDRVKDFVGGEIRGDGRIGGACGVDAHQHRADLRGEGRIGVAVAQPGLPERMRRFRQERHRQRPAGLVLTQQ